METLDLEVKNKMARNVVVAFVILGFFFGVLIGYYFIGLEVESTCYKNIIACEEHVSKYCIVDNNPFKPLNIEGVII